MATPLLQLSDARREQLTALFRKFDLDGDGFLSLQEFRLFGWAVTGRRRVPTDAEVWAQINRADENHDGQLSLDEFLAFSRMLARLSDDAFGALLRSLNDAYEEANRRGFAVVLEGSGGGGGGSVADAGGGGGGHA